MLRSLVATMVIALAGWTGTACLGTFAAPAQARAEAKQRHHRPASPRRHRVSARHRHRVSSRQWHRVHRRGRAARGSALIFGIYPGGAAGTVGPGGQVKPEDPARRLAALEELRPPGRPFVLRLYAGYYGPGSPSASDQLGPEITTYTDAGFEIEVALTYRPQDGGSPAAVAGFLDFTRSAVQALGPNRRVVSLQVTNEANVGGAPNASDGSYADAAAALLGGVTAAKEETDRAGFSQINVGFNVAYVGGDGDRSFWRYLGSHSDSAFTRALDWVGVDLYPGTWGPSLGSSNPAAGTTEFIGSALQRLSTVWLPLAGIRRGVALHISETGYPTGPGRSGATQAQVMRATVAAVSSARSTHPVTSLCWFDLRDADSATSDFETQYGLLHDDYSPKPAFAVYRALVSQLSAP